MVTLVKHEWHQVDSQFAIELDENLLAEIYPDLDEDEIAEKLQQIENGEIDIEDVVNDAYEEGVDLEWDRQYDDWWTERKGGYDVTYELGDESSWVTPDTPPEPTHKCTKCRWEGQSYQTSTIYLREDGSVIENYFDSDEEHHSTKDACPMCDSDLALTEAGLEKEKEAEERRKRWAEMDDEEEVEFDESPEHAECTVCDWAGPEIETLTIEGQMCCPECREPVWTAEQVAEQRQLDLQEALEELKLEFEKLIDSEEVENTEETPTKKKKK